MAKNDKASEYLVEGFTGQRFYRSLLTFAAMSDDDRKNEIEAIRSLPDDQRKQNVLKLYTELDALDPNARLMLASEFREDFIVGLLSGRL